MIEYTYDEEKVVALFMVDQLNDFLAKAIIQKGEVSNKQEAIHLSKGRWFGSCFIPSFPPMRLWYRQPGRSSGQRAVFVAVIEASERGY